MVKIGSKVSCDGRSGTVVGVQPYGMVDVRFDDAGRVERKSPDRLTPIARENGRRARRNSELTYTSFSESMENAKTADEVAALIAGYEKQLGKATVERYWQRYDKIREDRIKAFYVSRWLTAVVPEMKDRALQDMKEVLSPVNYEVALNLFTRWDSGKTAVPGLTRPAVQRSDKDYRYTGYVRPEYPEEVIPEGSPASFVSARPKLTSFNDDRTYWQALKNVFVKNLKERLSAAGVPDDRDAVQDFILTSYPVLVGGENPQLAARRLANEYMAFAVVGYLRENGIPIPDKLSADPSGKVGAKSRHIKNFTPQEQAILEAPLIALVPWIHNVNAAFLKAVIEANKNVSKEYGALPVRSRGESGAGTPRVWTPGKTSERAKGTTTPKFTQAAQTQEIKNIEVEGAGSRYIYPASPSDIAIFSNSFTGSWPSLDAVEEVGSSFERVITQPEFDALVEHAKDWLEYNPISGLIGQALAPQYLALTAAAKHYGRLAVPLDLSPLGKKLAIEASQTRRMQAASAARAEVSARQPIKADVKTLSAIIEQEGAAWFMQPDGLRWGEGAAHKIDLNGKKAEITVFPDGTYRVERGPNDVVVLSEDTITTPAQAAEYKKLRDLLPITLARKPSLCGNAIDGVNYGLIVGQKVRAEARWVTSNTKVAPGLTGGQLKAQFEAVKAGEAGIKAYLSQITDPTTQAVTEIMLRRRAKEYEAYSTWKQVLEFEANFPIREEKSNRKRRKAAKAGKVNRDAVKYRWTLIPAGPYTQQEVATLKSGTVLVSQTKRQKRAQSFSSVSVTLQLDGRVERHEEGKTTKRSTGSGPSREQQRRYQNQPPPDALFDYGDGQIFAYLLFRRVPAAKNVVEEYFTPEWEHRAKNYSPYFSWGVMYSPLSTNEPRCVSEDDLVLIKTMGKYRAALGRVISQLNGIRYLMQNMILIAKKSAMSAEEDEVRRQVSPEALTRRVEYFLSAVTSLFRYYDKFTKNLEGIPEVDVERILETDREDEWVSGESRQKEALYFAQMLAALKTPGGAAAYNIAGEYQRCSDTGEMFFRVETEVDNNYNNNPYVPAALGSVAQASKPLVFSEEEKIPLGEGNIATRVVYKHLTAEEIFEYFSRGYYSGKGVNPEVIKPSRLLPGSIEALTKHFSGKSADDSTKTSKGPEISYEDQIQVNHILRGIFSEDAADPTKPAFNPVTLVAQITALLSTKKTSKRGEVEKRIGAWIAVTNAVTDNSRGGYLPKSIWATINSPYMEVQVPGEKSSDNEPYKFNPILIALEQTVIEIGHYDKKVSERLKLMSTEEQLENLRTSLSYSQIFRETLLRTYGTLLAEIGGARSLNYLAPAYPKLRSLAEMVVMNPIIFFERDTRASERRNLILLLWWLTDPWYRPLKLANGATKSLIEISEDVLSCLYHVKVQITGGSGGKIELEGNKTADLYHTYNPILFQSARSFWQTPIVMGELWDNPTIIPGQGAGSPGWIASERMEGPSLKAAADVIGRYGVALTLLNECLLTAQEEEDLRNEIYSKLGLGLLITEMKLREPQEVIATFSRGRDFPYISKLIPEGETVFDAVQSVFVPLLNDTANYVRSLREQANVAMRIFSPSASGGIGGTRLTESVWDLIGPDGSVTPGKVLTKKEIQDYQQRLPSEDVIKQKQELRGYRPLASYTPDSMRAAVFSQKKQREISGAIERNSEGAKKISRLRELVIQELKRLNIPVPSNNTAKD